MNSTKIAIQNKKNFIPRCSTLVNVFITVYIWDGEIKNGVKKRGL
jgi:hypothetical protein